MLEKISIHDMQINNRPRERLFTQGAEYLTDAELLAILLRVGGKYSSAVSLSEKVLKKFGGLEGLFTADTGELLGLPDVGEAKAAAVKAVCELALRLNSITKADKDSVKIESPVDVYKYMRKDTFKKQREHLYLLSLNSRKCIVSKDLISIGTLNETLLHPREIYKVAIAKSAASIILVHNHPSNNTEPSEEDIEISKRIAEAGKVLGIGLIDHVIVSDTSFTSLKSLNKLTTYEKLEWKGGEYNEENNLLI